MPLIGIEGLEGCSQWNVMPRSDMGWWLTGLAAEKQEAVWRSPQYDHEDAEFFSSARLPPARTAGIQEAGAYMAWIDAILEGDRRVHKKQRHTAHRIFERLRDEQGFTGGYTIVREYVAQAMLRTREMFVPLSHCPGHAQADFGEADGYIGGKKVRFHYVCMDLPHSDGCFVKAYPAETAEAFCDGHVAAIDFFGGVPELVIARCDAPEILEPSEAARGDVAPFVGLPVVADTSCGWICPG